MGDQLGARGAALGRDPVTAAIILAGGRSRRFGSDKVRHRIDGITMFERTLWAASACRPVVVVTASELADELMHAEELMQGRVPAQADVIAVSEHPRWGGPGAALAAGLDALAEVDGDVIVLPADLSDPDGAVATLLDLGEGVLTDGDDRPQWLVARASIPILRARVARLRAGGGKLDDLPASSVMSVVSARMIAPDHTIRDIDTPADLARAGHPQEELTRGTR
jgi:molybdopterin-guanine dinucleotide biosynthesis protein A